MVGRVTTGASWDDQRPERPVLGGVADRGPCRTNEKDADVNTWADRNSLVRPRQDRILAGVCAGLGRRFGLSPWTARLLFVLVLMLLPGSQLIVYPILWVLMPDEGSRPTYPAQPPYPGA